MPDVYTPDINCLSYARGARVTWVSRVYNVSNQVSINGGYTGPSPVTDSTSGFWGASNTWNVQGCVENDDSKTSIANRHNGSVKAGSSATTMQGDNTVLQKLIINPRAYQGDIADYLFRASSIYLASANSDGDVGLFELFVSTSDDLSVATNPDHPSWVQIGAGALSTDGSLVEVNFFDQSGVLKEFNFRFLKLHAYARNKSYFELAAFKVFATLAVDEPPVISNPRLTNSNVWFTDTGDIKLTVDIVDIEGSQIRCNLLVNGVEEGWTAYLDSPITLDFYISKDSLEMGDNSVVLNIEDTVGNVSTLSFLIVKEGKNTNPIVRILEFADEWSQGEKIEVVYGAGLQFKEGQVGQDYIVTGASQIRTEGKANISSVSIQGTNLDDVITNVNSIETMINRSSLGAGWVSEYSLDLERFKAVNSIEVI